MHRLLSVGAALALTCGLWTRFPGQEDLDFSLKNLGV